MPSKAIFWDFDRTLAHNPLGWSRLMHQTLLAAGHEVPFAAVKAHISTGFTWHTPERGYPDRMHLWWDDLFAHFATLYAACGIPQAGHAPLSHAVRAHMIDPASYVLYEDAIQTLRACIDRGYTNHILSNNHPELAAVVRGLGLAPYIRQCIVSACVGYEKPHPALFEAALRQAGFPAEAFMVGDNPIADIQGGKAAGMRTVLVHNDAPSNADFVFGSLAEVVTALE